MVKATSAGGAVAQQFAKPKAKAADKSKKKAETCIRRPWTISQFEELSKEERDIVLDRVAKEVATLVTAEPTFARACVLRGVNKVARAIPRREVGVVVFAANPNTQPFGHIPMLCRLYKTPICVLHLSSKALGALFGLKSLAVVALRKPSHLPEPQDQAKGDNSTADAKADEQDELTQEFSPRLIEQLQSITKFLASKASRKNNNIAL
ncbi:TPA: hypothetical protein N0F65_001284 [Lagenidium giganteum]|uniref:Ribosomal protein eL8/eL30/eS12/Gadd45 domain-containing protein n=1 Tax=Lagenidium giganteum TaxID=4803 RepID=A0AAV2Z0D1_9STRA|nr:TPA: hypothetical protein N0F65_001284 [Lagenidium giganteum]